MLYTHFSPESTRYFTSAQNMITPLYIYHNWVYMTMYKLLLWRFDNIPACPLARNSTEPTELTGAANTKLRSECPNLRYIHKWMCLLIVIYPIDTKKSFKCVCWYDHRVLSSKNWSKFYEHFRLENGTPGAADIFPKILTILDAQ